MFIVSGPEVKYAQYTSAEIIALLDLTESALAMGKIHNRESNPHTVNNYYEMMKRGAFIWEAQNNPMLLKDVSLVAGAPVSKVVAGGLHRLKAAAKLAKEDNAQQFIFPIVENATDEMIDYQDLNRSRTVGHSSAILANVNYGLFKPFSKSAVLASLKQLWVCSNYWPKLGVNNSFDVNGLIDMHGKYLSILTQMSGWCSQLKNESFHFWKQFPILTPLIWAFSKMDAIKYKQFLTELSQLSYAADSPGAAINKEFAKLQSGNGARNPTGYGPIHLNVLRALYAVQHDKTMSEMKKIDNSTVEVFFDLT